MPTSNVRWYIWQNDYDDNDDGDGDDEDDDDDDYDDDEDDDDPDVVGDYLTMPRVVPLDVQNVRFAFKIKS